MSLSRGVVRWRVLVVEATAVAAGTLLLLLVHLRAWRAAWREPWLLGGDSNFYLMITRSLEQHGSYLHNANLGWPFGQTTYDLPQGVDNAHLVVLRALTWITGGPGAAVNVFYVLTFFAVAFTSHIVLRILGCSRIASALGAFLYAFAPYHFLRGEGHILLSGYELVPIAVLLALWIFEDPLPLLRAGSWRIDWRAPRTWLVVAFTIGLASTGAYYFVFSMLVIAAAGIIHALAARTARPLMAAGVVLGVGAVTFCLNLAPTLLFMFQHGQNLAVAHRSPFETQVYGLRISQLFIPREGHRVGALLRLSARAQGQGGAFAAESGQQLGLIGAVALAAMLLALAVHAVGRRRDDSESPHRLLVRRLGVLAVVCMLVGAMGGLSFLLSSAGLRDIRAWNRISIVIAWLAVIVVAVSVDAVGSRLAGHRNGRFAPQLIAVALLVIGFFDQAGRDAPDYRVVHAQYVSDTTFFRGVKDVVGPGAAVYNIPFEPFPEEPPRVAMGAYDQSIGYIYEPSLRWSYGFMRGRHPDYPRVLEGQPADQWMTSIAAIGFAGIVVDRYGYRTADAVAQEAAIAALVGPAVITSLDGQYAFFDLRGYAQRTRDRLGPTGTATRAVETLALHSG
jgi:phosphoglycerol transferase